MCAFIKPVDLVKYFEKLLQNGKKNSETDEIRTIIACFKLNVKMYLKSDRNVFKTI